MPAANAFPLSGEKLLAGMTDRVLQAAGRDQG
jgi:hypothetical protein